MYEWTQCKNRHYLSTTDEPPEEWLGFYDGHQIAVRAGRWPNWQRVCLCTLPFDDAHDFIKTAILAQTKALQSRKFVIGLDDTLLYPHQRRSNHA